MNTQDKARLTDKAAKAKALLANARPSLQQALKLAPTNVATEIVAALAYIDSAAKLAEEIVTAG